MSTEWEKIHGAKIASIKRAGGGKKDIKRIAGYFSNHYLSNQALFVRFSYSWRKLGFVIGKSWNAFKREVRKFSPESTMCGLNPSSKTVPKEKFFSSWDDLITLGHCIVGNLIFFKSGLGIDCCEM